MPDRDQSHSSSASFGVALRRGLGATGLRLRLTGELSDGFMACRHATTGQLLLQSSVIVPN